LEIILLLKSRKTIEIASNKEGRDHSKSPSKKRPHLHTITMAIPAPPMQRSLFLATVKLAQEVGSVTTSGSGSTVITDPANTNVNSTSVLSTAIRQSNAQGEILSVGEWSRQTIVQDGEWLIKIAKRDKDTQKNGSGVVRITFGNGYDALVAINTKEVHQDISEINTVGVVVCISTVNDDDDATRLKHQGLVNPSDSIFDHMQACVEGGQQEQDIRIYIHTNVSPWTNVNGSMDRTQIYHVQTDRNDPSSNRMKRLLSLEEQLRATGKIGTLEEEKKSAANKSAPKKIPTTEKKPAAIAKPPSKAEKERAVATKAAPSAVAVAGFNPKEIILLARAFNNKLSKFDKKDVNLYWTQKDVKKAVRICKAAEAELGVIAARSRQAEPARSELPKNAEMANAAKEPTISSEKPAPEESPSKKKTAKRKKSTQPVAEKSAEEPKSSTKKTKEVEAQKSPTKETKHLKATKDKTPKKKPTTTATEKPKSATEETKEVKVPKSATKETKEVEVPKSPEPTRKSKRNKGSPDTSTDQAETPKKHKSKNRKSTGPTGTIKKAAPEETEKVETPVESESRKRKSTTLELSENVDTDTSGKKRGRPKRAKNKPK
jgi:hypothetical protein